MTTGGLRPLLGSYGGGHAQIIAALATGFIARGDRPDVIGFTTAHAELHRQGIAARPVSALLDPDEDAEWLALAGKLTRDISHPDIPREETCAYFAIGLRDLARETGRATAIARVRAEGRTAFEPVQAMRRYLRRTRPDIVLATTSPRFELALLKAARLENIPSLSVGDLFLVDERPWILGSEFSENLAVLSAEVARSLIDDGFPEGCIRVTGNPAFDRLKPRADDGERRAALRADLGVQDKTVILFPVAGGSMSMDGRPFLDAPEVVATLEAFCDEVPAYSYLIRPHPNRPITLPSGMRHGVLDDGLSPEEAILVSDIVCVENSTMGLQAALIGKPVICIGFADHVLYPDFGLGQVAATLDEAVNMLRAGREAGEATIKGPFEMPPLGTATANVLEFVDEIISRGPCASAPQNEKPR